MGAAGLVTTLACAGWLGTGGGSRWVANRIEDAVESRMNGGRLRIESLRLGWRRWHVGGVHLVDADGKELLAVDRIEAKVDLLALLGLAVHVPEATVSGARVELRQLPDGTLDWASLFRSSGGTGPTRTPVDVRIDALALESVDVRFRTPTGTPLQLADGWLLARFVAHDTTFDLSDVECGLDLVEPGAMPVNAWGGLQWDTVRGLYLRDFEVAAGDSHATARGVAGRTMNLAVAVDHLEGADVGTLLGRPLTGTWNLALGLKGPPEDFEVVAAFGGGEAGAVVVAGRADVSGDVPRWALKGELAGFHVEALEPALGQPLVLGGIARLEGSGATVSSIDADGTWQGGAMNLYGQPVDAVDATLAVRGGYVRIAPSLVEGVLGTMTVSGVYSLASGDLDVTVDSDLAPARLAALGTTGLDGSGRVTAEIRRAPGDPVVHVDGVARYAPFVYGRDVRAASVTAPFSVTVEGGRTRGTFDLGAAAVSAYGVTTPSATGRGMTFVREPDGALVVDGTVSTPSAAYGTRFGADTASTAFTFRMEGGHRLVDATTTVGPHHVLGLPSGGGTVGTRLRDDDVRAEVHLADSGRRTLDVVARYDLGSARLALDGLAFAPTPRARWRAVGPATLTVVDGGVADAALLLRSELGEVELSGDLATAGPLDGTVTLRGFELDHLTELWPDDYDLAGRMDLVARVSGRAEDPTVAGEVAIERLFANGSVRWLDVRGGFEWARGALAPDLSMSVVGAPLFELDGAVGVTGGLAAPSAALDDAASWTLAIAPGPLARFATAFPALDGTELPEGVVSGALTASGPLGDPDLRLALVSETKTPGFTLPARAELDLRRRAGEATYALDLREDLGLRASVDGTAATRTGEVVASLVGRGPELELSDPAVWLSDLAARVALVSLPTAGLAPLAGTPPLGGELVGGFVLSGDPTHPVVDGGVNWVGASVGGQPFDGLYFALLPEAGGYHLDLSASLPDGGGLEVTGSVPVAVDLLGEVSGWSTAPMALEVAGAGVPVSLLGGLDPSIRGVSGLVKVAGTVGGPVHDPRPELTLRGRDLGILYRPLLLSTEGASLDATVTADQVTFDVVVPTLPARKFTKVDLEPGAEPRIRSDGAVGLAEWGPTTIEAKVHFLDGAWVSATDLTKIRTTGDLRIDGTWPEVKVKGDLALVQGLVRVEAAGADVGPTSLAPGLSVERLALPPAPEGPPVEEPSELVLDANVAVDLGRNLQFELSMPFVDQLGELGAAVSRVDLSTRVGGSVKVKAQDGAPTLVGELELVEGTVRMMRSTFDLQEGHVTFVGGDPYEDAELDVLARMAVSGSALDLRITGTPVEPMFALSSDEYPDPTEQMVILVTGAAPDELSADQGAGAALSLLWSSAFAGMRLGSFSIEPSGAVRLGMPVSRSIYTSTTWSLSQDPTANQLTFEADWSLTPHLVLVGAAGDRQSWGDLYWEIKF